MKQTKKTSKKKAKITKKMTFAQIMDKNPKLAVDLANKGMFCCGCGMAAAETLEEGAIAHGMDADKLVKELNKER